MATQTRKSTDSSTLEIQVPAFVTTGIEAGRARLKDLESQAQDVLKDLYARGNRGVEDLRERLPIEALRERIPVDDLVDRARDFESEARTRAGELAADLEQRLQDIQNRTLALVGVASQGQIETLSHDIDRLARRVDRLTRATKATGAKKPASRARAAKTPARKKAPARRS